MLNLKKISLTILFLSLFYLNVKMQTPSAEQQRYDAEIRRRRELEQQMREREDLNRRETALRDLASGSTLGRYEMPGRGIPSISREARARIRAILSPDARDAAKYKDFLRGKNTGLFRLFPDFDCESKNVVRADGECASLVSGSWNYSFRRKNYSDIDFLDIQFKDGNLISKGLLAQGILARLGDVALEDISSTSAGVKFLLDFAPANQIADAKKQFVQISRGIESADGYKYSNSVRAAENTTYILRAVAYRRKVNSQEFSESMTRRAFRLANLNFADKRIDITIAFRIVRHEQNGSITILWKEINRQDAPKIVFAKNEKFSDIKPEK